MLVLQPSTFIDMAGLPMGSWVTVADDVGVNETIVPGVSVLTGVDVNTTGVAEALVTPMMTGVWVKMEGVGVKGINGVGGLLGSG